MTHHYIESAQSIVEGFKEMLSEEAIVAVGEENFGQLQVLVEAAITTALLDGMEQVADKIDALGHEVRNSAEHYDDN